MIMSKPPFVVTMPVDDGYPDTAASVAIADHPEIGPLFDWGRLVYAENASLQPGGRQEACPGRHRSHSPSVLRVMSGQLKVELRWVDDEGRSRHCCFYLSQGKAELLVVPVGVWYLVTYTVGFSVYLTLYTSPPGRPDTAEIRLLPPGYSQDHSTEFGGRP
jgi:hypothetical protein